jgi:hypothetical protein
LREFHGVLHHNFAKRAILPGTLTDGGYYGGGADMKEA